MISAGIVGLIAIFVGVPLAVNDDLRYNLALQTNVAPGKDATWLADEDDGALLIVVPLENGDADGTSPWLYRAQFIAWPSDAGNEIENLENGQRAQLPLSSIDFTSANADGSIVLLRGVHKDTGNPAAFTIDPHEMAIEQLATADAVPDAPGDWETPTWEKTRGTCNRPSPGKRFIGCFNRADTASYLAGDWQFDLQIWGDFESVEPLFRGQGFLPWVGFAQDDTVVYLQNERGIVRIDVPESILAAAPQARPYSTPVATPAN